MFPCWLTKQIDMKNKGRLSTILASVALLTFLLFVNFISVAQETRFAAEGKTVEVLAPNLILKITNTNTTTTNGVVKINDCNLGLSWNHYDGGNPITYTIRIVDMTGVTGDSTCTACYNNAAAYQASKVVNGPNNPAVTY